MDVIREQLEKPLVAGIVGLVVGLLIGLVVLGWGLWPVQWTDAAPEDLREEMRVDYLRMAIDSFALRNDEANAQTRWAELGEAAGPAMEAIQTDAGPQADTLQAFKDIVATEAEVATPPDDGEEEGGFNITFLLIMCLITLLLAGALAAYFLVRQGRGSGPASPAAQAQEISNQIERTDYSAMGSEPPISQFVTTYMLGDDLFDDSFSVDSQEGEFLGECGVGISEALGVGEPKKVAAFEIWLFDKNDIQTVTKVLMSEHAFEDEALRLRLATKGEPFQAEPGADMVLETATLRLIARVVDMAYGSGAMPANSFFDRVTLELAIWKK